MESQPSPQQQYQTAPTNAELIDAMRNCAINLSDAIKAANERGIGVSITQAPEGSSRLIHLTFVC